jgi:hypothetical protein
VPYVAPEESSVVNFAYTRFSKPTIELAIYLFLL